MNFQPFEYMEWAKLVAPAANNLSRSGQPVPPLEALGVDMRDLSLYGDHPYGYFPLLREAAGHAGVSPDNVIVCGGASAAIFLISAALLEPGDHVLVEKPAYEPLLSVPRTLGAEVGRIERTFENGYRIDLDRLERSLTKRTKLLVMTNLHNPSGVYLTREEISAIAERAARVGARVFIDEVYLEFLSGPRARTSFGLAENIITAASLTKAYGLAGLRCGWILAPSSLMPLLRHVVDHVFVEQVFMAEQMSALVFPKLAALRERNRPGIDANHRRVAAFMEGETRLEWIEPENGLIAFPRLKNGGSGDELARLLKEKYETSVVPGRFFENPGHFRLGFGAPAEALERGLAAISRALDNF
jgi:aspartate/methionine/tyrosine aminotransferase